MYTLQSMNKAPHFEPQEKKNIDYKDFLLYNSKIRDSLEFRNFNLNGVV